MIDRTSGDQGSSFWSTPNKGRDGKTDIWGILCRPKDFDLLVVPGAGHGMGGAYGQRRMQDFFVRNLLGVEPDDRSGT